MFPIPRKTYFSLSIIVFFKKDVILYEREMLEFLDLKTFERSQSKIMVYSATSLALSLDGLQPDLLAVDTTCLFPCLFLLPADKFQ